jgi:hypothetical protein
MKLFASGCSFTWGGELIKTLHDEHGSLLDEHNQSDINKHRLNITWPKHLSDKLGCTEFHNHSIGCGSNARIVRKTLDFFVPKVLTGEDMSDWTVAIQWSEPSRFEFFDNNTNDWAVAKHDVVIFRSADRELSDTEQEDIIRTHYAYSTDVAVGQQFFTQISALGNFFKAHGIKYVFTMIHEGFTNPLSESQLSYCNTNFNWYNNDIMQCSIDKMKAESCEQSPHPSELGHKQIAENLSRFLSAQN